MLCNYLILLAYLMQKHFFKKLNLSKNGVIDIHTWGGGGGGGGGGGVLFYIQYIHIILMCHSDN